MDSHPTAARPRLSRRQFIHATTTGTLAALAIPGLSCRHAALRADSTPSQPLRFSLCSVMVAELPLEEVCERAAQLGFAAIDIWCPFDNCHHLADAVQRLGPDGLKQLLARHRLALGSFTTYTSPVEKVGFPAYADFIRRVGGGLVVRGSSYAKFEPGQLTRAMRKFFEQLKPQIEQAAQAGAVLAIENHSKALLSTPDSLKAFVDLNPAARHVGLALAPFHLQRIEASVEEAMRSAGSQLRFFYAWQKAEGMRQLPGHGPADFTPWLRALAGLKYSGYINPFMHGHFTPGDVTTALVRSRDYLEQCHARSRLA
jgi:sugar phosphate isomerase/epimerase